MFFFELFYTLTGWIHTSIHTTDTDAATFAAGLAFRRELTRASCFLILARVVHDLTFVKILLNI